MIPLHEPIIYSVPKNSKSSAQPGQTWNLLITLMLMLENLIMKIFRQQDLEGCFHVGQHGW